MTIGGWPFDTELSKFNSHFNEKKSHQQKQTMCESQSNKTILNIEQANFPI